MAKKNSYRNSERRDALSELFSDPLPQDSPQSGSELVRNVLNEMNSSTEEEIDRQIQEADNNEKMPKKLIPGETLIGIKGGTIQGELKQIKIYYGNFVNPMNIHNGKYIPLKKKEYMNILNEFLDSEEGKQYQRPTEEENDSAFAEVKASVDRYLESQNRKQPGMMQPGRSQAAPLNSNTEPAVSDKGGQPETPEEQHFADDMSEEERKEVELIQAKQYTKQQMKEIRKGFDSERRRSTLGTAAIIVVALLVLGIAFFLIKDVVVKLHAVIELELKANEITIRAGDSFNAPDYVKSVTDDEGVYVIYPNLDTKSVGIHRLDYVATNGIKNVKKTLKVFVIDGESPVIVLTDEEILLVRGRDEEGFDPLKYVKETHDNLDEDLDIEVNDLDWSKDEQSLTYRVKDSAGNSGSAVLLVKIEDKAVCDPNAIYNSTTNTCRCKSGYTGDGSACKIVSSSGSGTTNSDSSNSNQSSGNSGGNDSSGTSWNESWTADYTDYQPSNGQTDVTYTNNDTGESYTVHDSDVGPYESDEDLWNEIDNLGNP